MPLSAQKQRERRAAQRAAKAQDAARGQPKPRAPKPQSDWVGATRIMWVNESSVYATITEEAEKRRQRKSATSQPAAGSHGSLFLSTSLNFHTVNILSLRARGELWRRSKLAQIR